MAMPGGRFGYETSEQIREKYAERARAIREPRAKPGSKADQAARKQKPAKRVRIWVSEIPPIPLARLMAGR